MSSATKKPEGRSTSLQVRINRMLTRTNVDEGTAARNAAHFEVAANKHTWLRAISVSNLPSSAFRVGIVLLEKHLNSKTGLCFPSLETIAEGCKLPVRTARDGLDALRRQGFIITQKIGMHDPLFFFFATPSRVAEIRHSETAHPSGENSPSCVAEIRQNASGEKSAGNLLTETRNVTVEETVVPKGPPDAVGAEGAPPLTQGHSSPAPARPANVVGDGQTSDFLLEKEKGEAAIRCPTDPAEQREIVKAISGEPGKGSDHVNHQLLALLRSGKLTESVGATLVADWKQRGTQNAA
ncbi:helix-turn-helix domain-containing protein [Rhizobium skierniewicense]|uniref:helix-turn-helix domain-containing protein n=1 Tax=Rhizobium skierniewicense TaxID=984260 RepID=UPI001FAD6B7F|nr:helix-turn-helix domain-containing protein [Rhizobium skierniewicense]MCI9865052.1 helix-turn-helix domain-containing protein [Rhizobium skierniewicense]